MPFSRWMINQTVAHLQHRILLRNKYWHMQKPGWISRELCRVKRANSTGTIPLIQHSWNKTTEIETRVMVVSLRSGERGRQAAVAIKGQSEESFWWWKHYVSSLCHGQHPGCATVLMSCKKFKGKWFKCHGISLYYCLKPHVNYLKIKCLIKKKERRLAHWTWNPDCSIEKTASTWNWALCVSFRDLYLLAVFSSSISSMIHESQQPY